MTKIEIKVTSSGPFSLTITTASDEVIDVQPQEGTPPDAIHGGHRALGDLRIDDEEYAEGYDDDTEDDIFDEDEVEYEDEDDMISFEQCAAVLRSRMSS